MLLGRVLLSLRSTCSESVCLQRVFAVNEVSVRRLHHISTSQLPESPAHRFGVKLTVCDMQPASISYGKETTAIASDGGDDDEGGDGGESVVGQESRKDDEELMKIMMTSVEVEAINMEVQEGTADLGASTVSNATEEA